MTDMSIYFWEDCRRTLELWAIKTIECSKLGELFCGSLEDKNTERNAEADDLAC